MTGITHTAVGGAVGRFIPNPWIAALAGIVSHLIIDKVPHFWPQSKKAQDIIIWSDGFFSFSLFLIFALSPISNKASVLAGTVGSVSVDLLFVILPMLWKDFYSNPVRVWHERRQYHHQLLWWIATDVFLLVLALEILYLW